MPEISQEQLDKMLADIEVLKGITSETKRKEWQDRQSNDPSIKFVELKRLNGKTVVAWSNMTANVNRKLPNGDYEERLRSLYLFEDGEKEEMDYMDFARSNDLERCKIISSFTAKNPMSKNPMSKDPIENPDIVILNLERKDGTKLEVPAYAANP